MGMLRLGLPHEAHIHISSNYGRTVLLFLCLMMPLVVLSACVQNGYAEETPRSEESIRIAKYPDHVRRDGDTLYLKLASGAEVIFKDQSECETYNTCGDSYFEEYLSDLDLYILYFQLYEGGHYLVISGKSGIRYSMQAYPEVSPDRQRIVAVSQDETGYGENSIRLWRVEEGELIEEYYFYTDKLTGYNLNSFSEWQDNRTIRINRFFYSDSIALCIKPGHVEAQFVLRKIGDSWKLDKEFVEGTVNCTP